MQHWTASKGEARVEAIMEQIRQHIQQKRDEEKGGAGQSHGAATANILSPLTLDTNTLPSGPIPSHRLILGPFIVLAKQILRKIMTPYSRLVLREQMAFNTGLQAAVREVVSRLAERIDDISEHELREVKDQFAARSNSLDAYLQMLQRRMAELEAAGEEDKNAHQRLQDTFRALEERHRELFQTYLEQRQETLLQKRRLDLILTELRQKAKLGKEEVQNIADQSHHLHDHQYFLFETKFRGSSEEIRKRQEVFLPLFREVHESLGADELPVLDVGCGRGEFLEILGDASIPARGIELNEDMVHVCRERGLDVRQEDMFQHLQELPDESLAGVLASHVIEHLETKNLVEFVTLCHQKIRKGGIVAMETPNPLNLLVSTNNFWLDLSHIRPVHPEALQFLAESCGFLDPRVLYLSPCVEEVKFSLFDPGENPTLQAIRKNFEMLNHYFFGEQDYAVTARK